MGLTAAVVRVLDVCIVVVSVVFVIIYALATSALDGTLNLSRVQSSGVSFVAVFLATMSLSAAATVAHLAMYRAGVDAIPRAVGAHASEPQRAPCPQPWPRPRLRQ